jgi:hypothetical protein
MKSVFTPTLLSIAILLLLFTGGCSPAKPAGLDESMVISKTENILKAIDSGDFQAFTSDFSDKMISVFTQAQFDGLHALLKTSSGAFVSLGDPSLMNNQGYAVYRFPAKYADETVYVTITFLIGGEKVEGLFLDSANLRKADQ